MKKFSQWHISKELVSSVILFACVFIALIISNIEVTYEYYKIFTRLKIYVGIGNQGENYINKTVIDWVNEGFMAFFFFMLGLSMKYSMYLGEFQNKKRLLLPIFAAAGGFLMPATIYYFINIDNPESLRGIAIPVATDTAFVLAIIAFFGDKISNSLKIFIIGLSIIDDIFAVTTLSLFYTDNIVISQLLMCAIPLFLLSLLNINKIKLKSLYFICLAILWIFIVNAGVQGTIAGLITAFFIPTEIEEGNKTIEFLKDMEYTVNDFVAFFVLPAFALVNCELPLKDLSITDLSSPIAKGAFFGLFIGKPLGIFTFSKIAIKLNLCKAPRDSNYTQMLGVAILCGIGFTLSLFIGLQAFDTLHHHNQMKLGVFLSCFLSGILGSLVVYKGLK